MHPGEHGKCDCRVKNGSLTVATNSAYLLNTSGGSVTFRYMVPTGIGGHATWTIDSQFQGNPRILHGTFIAASDEKRVKILTEMKK